MIRSLLAASLLSPLLLQAEPLSKGERDRAMSHLHATRKQILDFVTPLSAAQYSFKPSPERWSIAECAEHITETEALLRSLAIKSIASLPVDDAKRDARKSADEQRDRTLLTTMTDRSRPASAPNEIRPTGRYPDKAKLLETFKQRRDETIRFIETTPDDLRSRFYKIGSNESDLYELILVISGHTERHLKQMQEVMASPNFPK